MLADETVPKSVTCMRAKRCMLLWIVPCVLFIIPIRQVTAFSDMYSIVPLAFLASYGIFLNFPALVKIPYSRPFYYEDLRDEKYVLNRYRNRFKAVFVAWAQLILAIILCGLIYYYSQKYNSSALSGIEIMGVMGGFISLFKSASNVAGTIVLGLVKRMKKYAGDPPKSSRTRSLSFALSEEDGDCVKISMPPPSNADSSTVLAIE